MRPNSSKVVAFISSWMALGCTAMMLLVVGFLSVLKPNVAVSLTRRKPSQICSVLPAALQSLAPEKLVP